MSEINRNVNEMDAAELLEQVQAEERNRTPEEDEHCGEAARPHRVVYEDPSLARMKQRRAQIEAEDKREKAKLRRDGKDSLYLGLLCALGVASLVGAAVTGVWEPVALGLGICLSGAAGILLYRARVVLRK